MRDNNLDDGVINVEGVKMTRKELKDLTESVGNCGVHSPFSLFFGGSPVKYSPSDKAEQPVYRSN